MKLNSNIPELIKKLEALKAKLADNTLFAPVLFETVNTGMGEMKNRIFNRGEDADNISLGKYVGKKTKLTKDKYSQTRYSIFGTVLLEDKAGEKQRKKQRKNIKGNIGGSLSEYEKYRLSRGRQIGYKDLELEGDLRRSIQCRTQEDGTIVVLIVNDEDAKKAAYQEKQIGNIRAGLNANKGNADPTQIFRFSQNEFDTIKNEGNAHINGILNELFSQL